MHVANSHPELRSPYRRDRCLSPTFPNPNPPFSTVLLQATAMPAISQRSAPTATARAGCGGASCPRGAGACRAAALVPDILLLLKLLLRCCRFDLQACRAIPSALPQLAIPWLSCRCPVPCCRYPTPATLPDGRVLIVGGVKRNGQAGYFKGVIKTQDGRKQYDNPTYNVFNPKTR